MTITQLLEMPVGKENRTGGFQLTVKVARKTVDVGKKHMQWVVFMDGTGEISGEICLPKRNTTIQKGEPIHITVCWLQPGEKGKKLYVDQWYPVTQTVDEYEARYHADWGSQDVSEAMEWQAVRREEIKGKCRHGVVCALIQSGQITKDEAPINDAKVKECVNRWVDFIVTGE